MKTAKFSRSESSSITFRIPLSKILDEHLNQDERDLVRGWTLSAWSSSGSSDADADGGGDDVLDISFTKTRDFKVDAEGALVETPRERGDHCATKKDVEALRTELEAVAQVAREGGQRFGG